MHYDVVVIGSGFGGAVTACRLAEAGMRVCILERGRWWSPDQYPLHNKDLRAWLWTGWSTGLYQYQRSENLDVLVGSGVGGGSLVYSNVLFIPPAEVFNGGWPAVIRLPVLVPYYERVAAVLHPSPYPRAASLSKTRALHRGAERTGRGEDFRLLDLAVYWGEAGVPNADPYGFGNEQTGCADLAECNTGCPIRAKNTLDLNYITVALRHGAECRPLHEVTNIARRGTEFVVHYRDRGRLVPKAGEVRTPRVVLAAGALGSTGLLLRAAYKHDTLGPLSPALGRHFSANGNLLVALTGLKPAVDASVGPVITAGIEYDREGFLIEDGGFPPALQPKPKDWPPINSLPLLLNGRDAADGRLRLTKHGELALEWSPCRSLHLFNAMERRVRDLGAALGAGVVWSPPWSLARKLITVHPLGGCRMADSPQDGVVNDRGAVYGQPGLYVADGSIIPTALGVNPALTIAALAERIAEHIVQDSSVA